MFSGGDAGLLCKPIGPEAADGGPIVLPRNGDEIIIDAEADTIKVKLYGSGALWK